MLLCFLLSPSLSHFSFVLTSFSYFSTSRLCSFCLFFLCISNRTSTLFAPLPFSFLLTDRRTFPLVVKARYRQASSTAPTKPWFLSRSSTPMNISALFMWFSFLLLTPYLSLPHPSSLPASRFIHVFVNKSFSTVFLVAFVLFLFPVLR